MIQFLYYLAHELCHGGMTGKRGENITEVSMNIVGIGAFLFPMEFYVFVGKHLHYSTFNDAIMLHH